MPILFLACANTENEKNSSVINFESGFSLYQDTISVNIKGEMTHALKYRDKFYLLFKQKVLLYGGYGKRWLYIFSNGEIEKVIDCPEEMKTTYLDFYVKNDSLILKPYMDMQYYTLDFKNYSWNKIDHTDDMIFEDDKFYVYSLDFGEWGGKTWFKDKKTGQEYVIEATTPLVNKIGTTYYLSNSFSVLKIKNPLLLNKCDESITYENIESTNKYDSWYGEPIGYEFIYQDTTINYFDFKYSPHIVNSFVWNNELLHIYETDTATYIIKIENNSIKTIQKIVDNISLFNWAYSYRCTNLNGNNKLLKFDTKEEQVFGLMEIIDNKIYVHYFVNKAILNPKPVGTAKADSVFIYRLNTILTDFTNLKLTDIDLKEKDWGSFDITPNHEIGIGDCWNPNKYTIDSYKSYLIKEDSIISNAIIYYTTKENDLVRVVTIDWDDEIGIFNSNLEKTAQNTFDKKINFLTDHITQKAGKCSKRVVQKNHLELIWEMPTGVTIELTSSKNYNNIRLIIYQNH